MNEEKAKTGQIEKQKSCTACGKPIKKLKRYYIRGKYYCSRKCYRKFKKSQKKL
jgi:predicted nucleic acid-binding Zn ribbon protein